MYKRQHHQNLHNADLASLTVRGKARPIQLASLRTDNHAASKSVDNQRDWMDDGTREEHNAPRTHYQMDAVETTHYPATRAVIATLRHGNAPHIFWSSAWK